jgi:rhodanese-related sulfurtransferase
MSSFKSGRDLIADAKTRIRLVSVDEVRAMLASPAPPRVLDVRDINETNLGRIPGATTISRGNLETKVEAILQRDQAIVIYCASDNRSSLAADTLREMGYTNVVAMAGGWGAWVASGGAVEG